MEKIAHYSDQKLLREHPVIMETMVLSNDTAKAVTLERGSVIGITEAGLKTLFAVGMTDAAGVLAGPVTIPAKSGSNPGEVLASVYVHANFVADQLLFADAATDADKTAALASLKTLGCYAS